MNEAIRQMLERYLTILRASATHGMRERRRERITIRLRPSGYGRDRVESIPIVDRNRRRYR